MQRKTIRGDLGGDSHQIVWIPSVRVFLWPSKPTVYSTLDAWQTLFSRAHLVQQPWFSGNLLRDGSRSSSLHDMSGSSLPRSASPKTCQYHVLHTSKLFCPVHSMLRMLRIRHIVIHSRNLHPLILQRSTRSHCLSLCMFVSISWEVGRSI